MASLFPGACTQLNINWQPVHWMKLFIKNLQFKSGVEETEVRNIVSFIKYMDDAPAIITSN